MLELNPQNFDQEISKGAVLVDFFASWCGPCQMIAPIIEELAKEFTGKVKIAKCNIDEYGDLAGRFGVMSIPTLVFLKNGEEQDRLMGLQQKKVIVEKLNSL